MTVSVTHAQQVSITTSPVSSVMALAMGRPSSPCNSTSSESTDPIISTPTSALRRLYFKSGRNAKVRTPTVPKVCRNFPFKIQSNCNSMKLMFN